MRYRLRTLMIILALGPLAIAGVIYVPQSVWDGRFTLNVHLVNGTGKVIDRIDSYAVSERKHANLYIANPKEVSWRAANLDSHGVAQIDVNCSGHVSALTGIELSYWQPEAIIIRAGFADGSQSLFTIDVPKRGNRTLEVNIPATE